MVVGCIILPLSSKNRLVAIIKQARGYFMKCCCCGNNFRGLIKKEGTKVSEEGRCPACKLLVGEYHFTSIYGRRVISRCVFTGNKK